MNIIDSIIERKAIDLDFIVCSVIFLLFFSSFSWLFKNEYCIFICLRCSFGWMICYSIGYNCLFFPRIVGWFYEIGSLAFQGATNDLQQRGRVAGVHSRWYFLKSWLRYWKSNFQYGLVVVLENNSAMLEKTGREYIQWFRFKNVCFAVLNGIQMAYGLSWKQSMLAVWGIFTQHYIVIICGWSILKGSIYVVNHYRIG